MGKVINTFTEKEIKILYKVLGDFIIQEEVLYNNKPDSTIYKVFDKLTQMKGIDNDQRHG